MLEVATDKQLSARLTAEEAAGWEHWMQLEQRGQRRQALQALAAWIALLGEASTGHQDDVVAALAAQIVDAGQALLVRYPLVERIIAPSLLRQYAAGHPAAPKWIAYFHQRFPNPQAWAGEAALAVLDEWELLREALRRNSADSKARQMLIERMVEYFNYTLHELPSGVLFGMDGATVAECAILRDSLEELKTLLQTEGMVAIYQQQITQWEFHFRVYAAYLTTRQAGQSYAEYVALSVSGC